MHETVRELAAWQVPTSLLFDEARHGLVVRLIGFMQERSHLVSCKPKEHRRVRIARAIPRAHLRIVGPILRASDVPRGVRRDNPYGFYPLLDFGVPVGVGKHGTVGNMTAQIRS